MFLHTILLYVTENRDIFSKLRSVKATSQSPGRPAISAAAVAGGRGTRVLRPLNIETVMHYEVVL